MNVDEFINSTPKHKILIFYSPQTVAAYQVAGRIDMLIFLPIFAIAGAMTTLVGMFYLADGFNGDLSNWDVSKVTDMSRIFYGAVGCTEDVSEWDVRNVRTFESAFGDDGANAAEDFATACASFEAAYALSVRAGMVVSAANMRL